MTSGMPISHATRCVRCGSYHVTRDEKCVRPDPQIAQNGIAKARRALAEALASLPTYDPETHRTQAERAALERAKAERRNRALEDLQ